MEQQLRLGFEGVDVEALRATISATNVPLDEPLRLGERVVIEIECVVEDVSHRTLKYNDDGIVVRRHKLSPVAARIAERSSVIRGVA